MSVDREESERPVERIMLLIAMFGLLSPLAFECLRFCGVDALAAEKVATSLVVAPPALLVALVVLLLLAPKATGPARPSSRTFAASVSAPRHVRPNETFTIEYSLTEVDRDGVDAILAIRDGGYAHIVEGSAPGINLAVTTSIAGGSVTPASQQRIPLERGSSRSWHALIANQGRYIVRLDVFLEGQENVRGVIEHSLQSGWFSWLPYSWTWRLVLLGALAGGATAMHRLAALVLEH